jgi:heme oxygenase
VSVRLIDRLNDETAEFHAEVDNELVSRPVNARRYQHYLVRTYGFVAPIERSISTTPDIENFVDLRRFNKEELLRRDLLALHYTTHQIDTLPQCTVPLFETAAEALGWAYFVERSTLAHSATFRYVASCIPGEVAFASSYLKCYFGAVGEMWRGFGDALELANNTNAKAVIVAARAAFTLYQRWRHDDETTSTSGRLRLADVDAIREEDTLS